MDISLSFLLDPNLAYLGLVLAFIFTMMALLVPGTGLLEILALFTIIYSVVAVVSIPINPVALFVLLVGVIPFIVALRWSRKRIYLVFSILALILGSSYLFVGEGWKPAVSPVLAVVVSITVALGVWVVASKIIGAETSPPAHDPDRLIGEIGEAATSIQDEGTLQINSELWSARSKQSIPVGAEARVIGRDGFTLIVEKAAEASHLDKTSPENARGSGG